MKCCCTPRNVYILLLYAKTNTHRNYRSEIAWLALDLCFRLSLHIVSSPLLGHFAHRVHIFTDARCGFDCDVRVVCRVAVWPKWCANCCQHTCCKFCVSIYSCRSSERCLPPRMRRVYSAKTRIFIMHGKSLNKHCTRHCFNYIYVLPCAIDAYIVYIM